MTDLDIVNKWIKENGDGREDFWTAKRMTCNDGFTMSVQASKYHYCSPRETGAYPYWSFEIGFPSRRIPDAHEYAEDKKRHTKTVFGFVPLAIVEKIIAKHGGLRS